MQAMYQARNYPPEPRAARKADINAAAGYHVQEIQQQPTGQPGIIYPRSSSMTSANSIDSNSQNHKSKLPHGLTVQELKEMTKARLQAETPGHHEKDFPKQRQQRAAYPQTQQRHYQQQPRHDLPRDARDNPYMQQSDRMQQRGPSGVPNVNMNRGYPQDRILSPSPSQSMSGPPGFQSYPSQNSLQSAERMSQQLGRDSWHKEAWETGSVASHNSTINSEYLDSESVYMADEFTDIPFNRTRSYPSGSGSLDRQYEGGPVYELSSVLTPNRRRAATSSPRLGLSANTMSPRLGLSGNTMSPRLGLSSNTMSPRHGLSHLHEDRPSFGGVPELAIPFVDSHQGRSQGNPISLRPLPAPPADFATDYPLRSRTYSGSAILTDGFAFNRPRTASAPSVSTFMSNTSDMFGNGGMSSLSPGHNDQLPSSIVESVLAGSSSSLAHDTSDVSSVFRSPSQDGAGLSNPWGVNNLGGLQGGVSNHLDTDSTLANDFGSVLSLSGVEPPPGNFAPREYPQVSLFPSLGSSGSGPSGDAANQQIHGIYGNQSSFSSGDLGRRNRDGSQGY